MTTKSPSYLRVRRRLDDPAAEFTLDDAAILIGVASETVRKRALSGEISHSKDTSRKYTFTCNAIRAYLGWPELES